MVWFVGLFFFFSHSEAPSQPRSSTNSQTKAPGTDSAKTPRRWHFQQRLCFPRQLILRPDDSACATGGQIPVLRNRGFWGLRPLRVPLLPAGTSCHAEFWDPSPFLLDARAGKDPNWQKHKEADQPSSSLQLGRVHKIQYMHPACP